MYTSGLPVAKDPGHLVTIGLFRLVREGGILRQCYLISVIVASPRALAAVFTYDAADDCGVGGGESSTQFFSPL